MRRPGVCDKRLRSDTLSGGTGKVLQAVSGGSGEGEPSGGRHFKEYISAVQGEKLGRSARRGRSYSGIRVPGWDDLQDTNK